MKSKKKTWVAFVLILLSTLLIGVSTAYFTGLATSQTSTAVPNTLIEIYYGNSLINGSTISLTTPQDITIKASNNFNITNAYLRAKVILNCYENSTGNILADYDPSDYVTITLSNFESVTGYDDGFVYYHRNNSFNLMNKTDPVTLISASNITKLQDAPAGTTIKLTVFAEAIQKDDTNYGLNKWRA